jgi:tetratricopeptide (TPR) repeat protein
MPGVRIPRSAVFIVLVTSALGGLVAAPATGVRVWRGTLQIPTYAEEAPNPNPPFDLFTFGRFNYPYPIRDALTDRRETVGWRTLNLENEYLRLTVLPDLGGHIYSCLDKRTGREMFYANTAIKKALIGYRGAWAAFGVEFNFPVSHNWVSMSPVDFALTEHPDGSGSIWVGNVDQVYGSQWRVELRLQPGRSVLDQHVELYNRSDVRHRYYWWSNGAVQVWEDSHLVYPTELMATHGFTAVEPWPIDRQGRDLSVIRNEVDGPVSLFTYQTREPFVGVYHPKTNSGTVHVADPAELPVHKFWSWGHDRDAATWRTALSDDDSAYVELQAGLFRNQETYAFLEPQETVQFSEHWLPVRDLGGITRANVDGVLHLERTTPRQIRIALDVTRDLPDARLTVRQGTRTSLSETVRLSPREVWRKDLDNVTGAPVTFELIDASGAPVLVHTENVFDRTPAAGVRLGPRHTDPASDAVPRSADDVIERGLIDELEGRRLVALARYREGLGQYPHSVALLKAAGRLAVALGWSASAAPAPSAIAWLEEASARNTTDFETRYYLGLALVAAGRPRDARQHFEAAERFRATRTPAGLQLARLSAIDGDLAGALRQLQATGAEPSRSSLASALEVGVLRRLGRTADALERGRRLLTIDPASSLVRHEMTLLGETDRELWSHLAADANRVLDLVDQYIAIGAYPDALGLLNHEYPQVEIPVREIGAVPPLESPLVAYYRGYVRQRLGDDPKDDYARARTLSTKYTFPSRPSSYAVLNDALRANPDDSTARFLLGSLYLADGLAQPAIAEWQRVRRVRPAIPTLHRNLGLALLEGTPNYTEARAALEEGIAADRENVEVYSTLDGVLSATSASPRERVAALRRFPAPDRMPSSLVYKLAIALAEAGEAADAERLFHDRFFPKEEGGTSVRAVYVQVRLAAARAAADARNCSAAREMLESLPAERPDLPFTAGGLADALRPPAMSRQVAAINWICGRQSAAREEWQRLERASAEGGAPMMLAIADEARRRLGHLATADQRRRLEAALDSTSRTLDSGDTSNPGYTELARASLLAALGRAEDSRQSMARVFLYPDRNLSHALAHSAMLASRSEIAR